MVCRIFANYSEAIFYLLSRIRFACGLVAITSHTKSVYRLLAKEQVLTFFPCPLNGEILSEEKVKIKTAANISANTLIFDNAKIQI